MMVYKREWFQAPFHCSNSAPTAPKKLGALFGSAVSFMRKLTLQLSATQPPNELFLSEDVRIFARGCDIYGAGWLRMTEGAGLAVSDWEN